MITQYEIGMSYPEYDKLLQTIGVRSKLAEMVEKDIIASIVGEDDIEPIGLLYFAGEMKNNLRALWDSGCRILRNFTAVMRRSAFEKVREKDIGRKKSEKSVLSHMVIGKRQGIEYADGKKGKEFMYEACYLRLQAVDKITGKMVILTPFSVAILPDDIISYDLIFGFDNFIGNKVAFGKNEVVLNHAPFQNLTLEILTETSIEKAGTMAALMEGFFKERDAEVGGHQNHGDFPVKNVSREGDTMNGDSTKQEVVAKAGIMIGEQDNPQAEITTREQENPQEGNRSTTNHQNQDGIQAMWKWKDGDAGKKLTDIEAVIVPSQRVTVVKIRMTQKIADIIKDTGDDYVFKLSPIVIGQEITSEPFLISDFFVEESKTNTELLRIDLLNLGKRPKAVKVKDMIRLERLCYNETEVHYLDVDTSVQPELRLLYENQDDVSLPEVTSTLNNERSFEENVDRLCAQSKNSYKKSNSKKEDESEEKAKALDEEIKVKEAKMKDMKIHDVYSEEWKDKVWKTLEERMDKPLLEHKHYADAIKFVIRKYAHVFHEEGCPAPTLKGVKASCEKRVGIAKMKQQAAYPLSDLWKKRMKFLINEEVKKGILEQWVPGMPLPKHVTPVFGAERKDNETGRYVGDFRAYNKLCLPMASVMPNQEAILQDLVHQDAKWLNVTDLATGYYQAELTEEERLWLAIITPVECGGIYFPNRLQLGPEWAPSWFQSHSRAAFSHHVHNYHVYIDDVAFKSKTIEDFIDGITEMFKCCERTGFVLSLRKTFLGVLEAKILGHIIRIGKGRMADPKKLELLQNWKLPQHAQELKSFVCVVIYLREYVWRLADKMVPLKPYLKGKDAKDFKKFETDELALRSFNLLKESLQQQATQSFIDYDRARNYKKTGAIVTIMVDASRYGKSFTIGQAEGFGKPIKPCVYKARTFTPAERKWTAYERELDAIKYFLEEGAQYCETVPAILLSDHANCGKKELESAFFSSSITSEKIERWAEPIIVRLNTMPFLRRWHIPGKLNILADAGSRSECDFSLEPSRKVIPASLTFLNGWLFGETEEMERKTKELLQEYEETLTAEEKLLYTRKGKAAAMYLVDLAKPQKLVAISDGNAKERSSERKALRKVDETCCQTQELIAQEPVLWDVTEETERLQENMAGKCKPVLTSKLNWGLNVRTGRRGELAAAKAVHKPTLIKKGQTIDILYRCRPEDGTRGKLWVSRIERPRLPGKRNAKTLTKWTDCHYYQKVEQDGVHPRVLLSPTRTSDEAATEALTALRNKVNKEFGAIGSREPSSGELWVQLVDTEASSHGSMFWDCFTHVCGPYEDLDMKGDWVFNRNERAGTSFKFKVYTLRPTETTDDTNPAVYREPVVEDVAINEQEISPDAIPDDQFDSNRDDANWDRADWDENDEDWSTVPTFGMGHDTETCEHKKKVGKKEQQKKRVRILEVGEVQDEEESDEEEDPRFEDMDANEIWDHGEELEEISDNEDCYDFHQEPPEFPYELGEDTEAYRGNLPEGEIIYNIPKEDEDKEDKSDQIQWEHDSERTPVVYLRDLRAICSLLGKETYHYGDTLTPDAQPAVVAAMVSAEVATDEKPWLAKRRKMGSQKQKRRRPKFVKKDRKPVEEEMITLFPTWDQELVSDFKDKDRLQLGAIREKNDCEVGYESDDSLSSNEYEGIWEPTEPTMEERVDMWAALDEKLTEVQRDRYTDLTVSGPLVPFLQIPYGHNSGARVLLFFRTPDNRLRYEFKLCGFAGFIGGLLKIDELMEEKTTLWGDDSWNFDGAIIYSFERENVDPGDPRFLPDGEELWRAAQQDCEDCKYKLQLLEARADFDEGTWRRKLGTKRLRKEILALKKEPYGIINGILHLNGLRVVPRCKTEIVLPGKETKAVWLRTYYAKLCHVKADHDISLALFLAEEQYGVTWPRILLDFRTLSKLCFTCLTSTTAVKYSVSTHESYLEKNQAWFLDLQGPFGVPKKYLCTIIDDATGWGYLRLINGADQKSCVTAIRSILREAYPDLFIKGDINPSVRILRNDWLKVIRSDNGFPYLRRYLNKMCEQAKLPLIAHLEGTAENPTGQHQIERPHKHLKKWVRSMIEDKLKVGEVDEIMLTKDMVIELERQWRNRPLNVDFRYRPVDLHMGRTNAPSKYIDEAMADRISSAADLRQQFYDFRQTRANEAQAVANKRGKLELEEPQTGDLVVVLLLKQWRNSKQICTGTYKRQILKVFKRRGDKVFLEPLEGDPQIRMKMPINVRKCKKLPQVYKDLVRNEMVEMRRDQKFETEEPIDFFVTDEGDEQSPWETIQDFGKKAAQFTQGKDDLRSDDTDYSLINPNKDVEEVVGTLPTAEHLEKLAEIASKGHVSVDNKYFKDVVVNDVEDLTKGEKEQEAIRAARHAPDVYRRLAAERRMQDHKGEDFLKGQFQQSNPHV